MGKVIFWIVVVFVVLFALRLLNTSKAKRRRRESGNAENVAAPAETMVRCDKCGVFLPLGDAARGAADVVDATPPLLN
jgi:hypothetical protein